MAKNRGLGRGLDALFSQSEGVLDAAESPKTEQGEYILQLPVSQIDINKQQPRKDFDDHSLAELAASIKANGLLQPIAVAKEGERYVIIAGERRYRAFRLLGYETIPAIVKNFTRQQSMELALVENIQRSDLNPIEAAAAIHSLMEEFGYTQQELSERLGMSRPALANAVRLLQLPASIADLVRSSKLSSGHARCLLTLEEPQQVLVAKEIVEKQLNVRQAEALVASIMAQKSKKPQNKALCVELLEAEATLRETLGTKVSIQGTTKKGKILIEYYSMEELERLLENINK